MAAILNSAILKSDMLDSAILHKTLTQTNSILNSAILDSPILLKTLTQSNSIWLKLIHSHSTWWWQPSWILPRWIQTLPSWIQIPCYLLSDSLKNTLTPLWLWIKLIQSDSKSFLSHTWWWQPSWILPSWIQPFCTKLWLKLIQSDSNSFILTQLDDGSHLEFCHLGFSHLCTKNFTHSQKNWLNIQSDKLIHSDSTWWWQPSWMPLSDSHHFWLWNKLQYDSNFLLS